MFTSKAFYVLKSVSQPSYTQKCIPAFFFLLKTNGGTRVTNFRCSCTLLHKFDLVGRKPHLSPEIRCSSIRVGLLCPLSENGYCSATGLIQIEFFRVQTHLGSQFQDALLDCYSIGSYSYTGTLRI